MTKPTTRPPMDPTRKLALAAGLFYLVTFVGSLPALPLYHDILTDPNHLLGSGSDTGVLWGAVLEMLCALGGIGSAIALYPVARRHSQTAALGFVAARTLEATMIFVGVASVLSLVTLHDGGAAAADSGSLLMTGRGFVALHDWSFLIGPGIMPAINAFCIGTVMYRTGLVPRILPKLGLLGAPLLLASTLATLFGVYDQISGWAVLGCLPIAAWELGFGLWLTFKGFRPAAVESLPASAPMDRIPVAV